MTGTNSTIGGGGFHHVAINARDFDKSVAFYKDVMGFATKIAWDHEGNRAIMLDVGDGNYLEIFEAKGAPPADGAQQILHFAIRTTDPDAALERARAAGCEVTMEPTDIDIAATKGPNPVPVRICFFKGPDGELIELFKNELT